jgi:putative colanic acid biosynthesis acetyltransferase WcaB
MKMSSFMNYILQDWQINRETSLKSRFVLVMFRSAQLLGRLPLPFSLFRFLYQLVVEWMLGIELPLNAQVGPNLQIQHGMALVINHETVIGANCILRHSTTIGNKKLSDGSFTGAPKIGNNVDIGSNVVILGPITVGSNAVIGAGSVVVKDVPEGAVVAGNPARVIRIIKPDTSFLDERMNQSELTSAPV